MVSGLRILFLLPFPPRLDATHGGSRVIAQFLTRIAARHSVALVYFRGFDEPPLDEALRERCELVAEVKRRWTGPSITHKIGRLSRLGMGLLQGLPLWVADWRSKEFAVKTAALARSWRPHLIQLEYHIMGQYLAGLQEIPAHRLLTELEPGISTSPYLRPIQPVLDRMIQRLDREAWMRYEPGILQRVEAVVVFTERDRKALRELGVEVPIQRIPFGTVIGEEALNPLGSEPPNLLFIGNFIHPPNIEAALRLARDIFPAVQARRKDLELFIVGANPPKALRNLASTNITITGMVPDVLPFFDRATVFVAPLSSGGGMRVKMQEALSAGKAIVTTPLGVEGLSVRDGMQVFLARTNDEFAERILLLLASPSERSRLAANARQWACENLGWERSIAAYESLYQSLLSGRAESRTGEPEIIHGARQRNYPNI